MDRYQDMSLRMSAWSEVPGWRIVKTESIRELPLRMRNCLPIDIWAQ